MPDTKFVPYCGTAPAPGELTWNLDPFLIGGFLLMGAAYMLGACRSGAVTRNQQALFASGWLIALAAFVSPLCSLSVSLFSARVTQHLILTLIAAPLIMLGRPERLLQVETGRSERAGRPSGRFIIGGAALFAAALWIWHLPVPYDATLRSNLVYWMMHLTTFGSALLLWSGLFLLGTRESGTAVIASLATAMQMGFLGAVLTFAPRPLFAVHFGTTELWGLSPAQDQQLGGLIMWVPSSLLFTIYALAAFGWWLGRLEAKPNVSH